MVYFLVIQSVCFTGLIFCLIDVTTDFKLSRFFNRRYRTLRNKQGLPHIENLDLRRPINGTKMEKWSTDLLTQIDQLVDELNLNGAITVFSPDKKTEWNLANIGGRLYVTFRTSPRNSWQRLNPGWECSQHVSVGNLARIILGQIMIGKRESGFRLEHLHCGKYISDHDSRDAHSL